MKLRNKKTGEVADFKIIADYDDCSSGWRLEKQDGSVLFYDFIDEIKEEWEDYKPKEPLIKNTGARDVMRLWAKVNHIPTNATTIEYHFVESLCGTESEFWDNNLHIMFYGKIAPNAVHGKIYTIDELCGEEEE